MANLEITSFNEKSASIYLCKCCQKPPTYLVITLESCFSDMIGNYWDACPNQAIKLLKRALSPVSNLLCMECHIREPNPNPRMPASLRDKCIECQKRTMDLIKEALTC